MAPAASNLALRALSRPRWVRAAKMVWNRCLVPLGKTFDVPHGWFRFVKSVEMLVDGCKAGKCDIHQCVNSDGCRESQLVTGEATDWQWADDWKFSITEPEAFISGKHNTFKANVLPRKRLQIASFFPSLSQVGCFQFQSEMAVVDGWFIVSLRAVTSRWCYEVMLWDFIGTSRGLFLFCRHMCYK